MAMKKKAAATKKAATKKGDEPVRVGRAKEQKVKGFISDPSGWMDPKVFRGVRSARGLGYQKDALMRVPKDASGKKISKQATADAKKLVEYGKKTYGTKFVVSISPDSGAYISKAGASKKAQKAQSARMTAQAKKKK
jgi:hypothetical protein